MATGATAKYTPERVLVIVAHPDDIEFGCAGTLARWIRDGATARYVLCTSGQVGIKDPTISMEEAARTREAEQTNAARAIGVQDLVFLRYQDGILENTMTLRKQLVREIRRFRPEVLICQDPTALFVGDNYINHPDHRAAGAAALDAVFPAAGMPALYQELEEEGLEAHETRKVYVSTWQNANTFVDITDTIGLKVELPQAARQPDGRLGPHRPHQGLGGGAGQGLRVRICRDVQGDQPAHGRGMGALQGLRPARPLPGAGDRDRSHDRRVTLAAG